MSHLNRLYFLCNANWNLLFFSNWIFLTSSWMEKPCTGWVPGVYAPSHLPVTNLSLPEFRWHAIFMLVFRSVFPLQLPALNSDGVELDGPYYLADPHFRPLHRSTLVANLQRKWQHHNEVDITSNRTQSIHCARYGD